MSETHPTRRAVLVSTALGIVAAPALAACGGEGEDSPIVPPSGEALVSLDELEDGVPTVIRAPSETPVVLTRSGDQVTALSAVCTHQGCVVRNDGAILLCPCHGSEFSFDGAVQKGPATEPLAPLDVAVQDGQVVTA